MIIVSLVGAVCAYYLPASGQGLRVDNMPSQGNQKDVLEERQRAAQYIRMSTEHQQYSTENQSDAIQQYAEKRGFEIVRTYADEGKSGLRIEGRNELKRLIEDVQSGNADFNTILVYDISRWGRFQDADESAYYEYICKRAGIDVKYCAEQFENDGSTQATIFKSVKRAMAGEYSRELSVKVFQGQCNLIEKGFRQGGTAGYGLRRMLIDQNGEPKGPLRRGEQKSLQTDRVILVPGPKEEVRTVRWIYRMFTKEGIREREIAEKLNEKGINSEWDRPWTPTMVRQILTNEKYVGNNVYNRVSFKLKKKRVQNPADMWVRADGAFEAIVDAESFYVAKGIIQERNRTFSDEEMLDGLRDIASRHSMISGMLIDETDRIPSSSAYRNRFGSLIRAYRLVGYTPERDYEFVQINRRLRQLHPDLMNNAVDELKQLGATVERDDETDVLLINHFYTTSIVLSRCRQTRAGALRWMIRFDHDLAPDITIVVRMDPANEAPSDYYLLPYLDMTTPKILLREFNGAHLDTYRFDTLDYFMDMARRARIEDAA